MKLISGSKAYYILISFILFSLYNYSVLFPFRHMLHIASHELKLIQRHQSIFTYISKGIMVPYYWALILSGVANYIT